ncbi:MAG: hypothetical protein MR599_00135 [Lactobacillus johnsonii]|nr:hypothetical protein [Lactobacillus johnsonii]
MEKAMYPSKVMRITQKDHEGTHAACWAVDEACENGNISSLFAPFTGKIKKIYAKDANEVWLESIDPVLYADGTKDYMTIMFCHDNDVSDLYVGKIIKQGAIFYQEGTRGNATGNHCHFECGRGRFTDSGWHKDSAGYWSINNGKKVTECLFIDDTYKILNAQGYVFKNVKEVEIKKYGTPVARNEYVNQIKINAENVRARKTPNGDILGYVNPGIYNSLEIVKKNNYDWHKIAEGLYCAMGEWASWLPKKEKPVEQPKSDDTDTKINELNKTIDNLNNQIKSLKEELNNANDQIIEYKNKLTKIPNVKFIFESSKLDYYAIKLSEKEKLYVGN